MLIRAGRRRGGEVEEWTDERGEDEALGLTTNRRIYDFWEGYMVDCFCLINGNLRILLVLA